MKNYFSILIMLCIGIIFSCKQKELKYTNPNEGLEITADKIEIKAHEKVSFQAQDTDPIQKYFWEFEGGSPTKSDEASPVVTYHAPGTYQVSLTVNDGPNRKRVTKRLFVAVDYNLVKGAFTGPTEGYAYTPIEFKDESDGDPTAWEWTFTPVDGGTELKSTLQNPAISFLQPGDYKVTLKASNTKYSDVVVKENYINIKRAFSSNHNITYEGDQITFQDESTGNVSGWQWTFTNQLDNHKITATGKNPSVAFPSMGKYNVQLQVMDEGVQRTTNVDGMIFIIPRNGLASMFRFDGNNNDEGPNKITTSTVGQVTFSDRDRKGNIGKAGSFDGASGVIVRDHAAMNWQRDAFTISFWVKTPSNAKMMVLQEGGKATGNTAGNRPLQYWFRLNDNNSTQRMRFEISDAWNEYIISSDKNAADDKWHHIAIVREDRTQRIYLDGVKVVETLQQYNLDVTSAEDFRIGYQVYGTNSQNFYRGLLDDVIMYRFAFSDQQISMFSTF